MKNSFVVITALIALILVAVAPAFSQTHVPQSDTEVKECLYGIKRFPIGSLVVGGEFLAAVIGGVETETHLCLVIVGRDLKTRMITVRGSQEAISRLSKGVFPIREDGWWLVVNLEEKPDGSSYAPGEILVVGCFRYYYGGEGGAKYEHQIYW